MAADPKYATTTATTTVAAASRPIQPLHTTQPIHHDPSSLLYPVSSSGRGFIPKPIDPSSSPLLAYSRGVPPPHFDYLNHYPHLPIKPLPLSPHPIPKGLNNVVKRIGYYALIVYLLVSDSISNGYKDTSGRERSQDDTLYVIRGRKVAPGSAVSDGNGYKDASTRDRSRDDSYYIIRGRKVRITKDASLYALCRSWLRNGVNEENQPQKKDVMKALPKPLPASMVASCMSRNKEDEKHDNEHEENEESVEHLSPQDLLKKHIKRARKVRARLREERLQRITRYRSRLRLLLPPPVEPFRNDTAAGN